MEISALQESIPMPYSFVSRSRLGAFIALLPLNHTTPAQITLFVNIIQIIPFKKK